MDNDLELEKDIINFLRFLRDKHPVKWMGFLLGLAMLMTHLKDDYVNPSKV